MRTRLEAHVGYFDRLEGGAANIAAGKKYYVDSSTGSNSNDGKTEETAWASLAYAWNSGTLVAGDTVYLCAGGSETVDAAADIDCDTEGVTVIGLGNGTNRYTITFSTATTADIDIDAANITFRNIRFIGAIASLAAPIDVNSSNFTIEDCDFYASAATTGVLITIIGVAAANNLTVRNCTFNYAYATDGTTAVTETSTEAIRLVGTDGALIEGCYFSGDFTTAAINGITTASKDIRILNNVVNNIATENIAGGIDLVAACTGYIDGNYCYVAYSSGVVFIDASSCVIGRNWVANAASESPTLFGTADSASTEAKITTIASDLVIIQASEDSDMVILKSDIAAVKSDLVVLQASEDSDVVVLKALLTTTTSDLVVLQASEDSDVVVLKTILETIASDLVALKAKYASDVP